MYFYNYGSLLELRSGQLVAAACAMYNLHVIDKELSGKARAIRLPVKSVFQLPEPQDIFLSMSIISSQSQDLIALSTSLPFQGIRIFALLRNALEPVQSIRLDFYPFRLVWLHRMQRLLVFSSKKSNRAASIYLNPDGQNQICSVQFDKNIQVGSCCSLRLKEKAKKIA